MVIYQKINLDARRPEDVLLATDDAPDDIILDCIRKISDVTFVDPETLAIMGHTRNGKCDYETAEFFKKSSIDVEYTTLPAETFDSAASEIRSASKPILNFDYERTFTVGSWGCE